VRRFAAATSQPEETPETLLLLLFLRSVKTVCSIRQNRPIDPLKGSFLSSPIVSIRFPTDLFYSHHRHHQHSSSNSAGNCTRSFGSACCPVTEEEEEEGKKEKALFFPGQDHGCFFFCPKSSGNQALQISFFFFPFPSNLQTLCCCCCSSSSRFASSPHGTIA
jgi:hypothetical protein